MKKIFLTFAIMSLTSFLIMAQTSTPGINAKQKNQHERIKAGVNNGELTKHEARNLVKQQSHIQYDKKIAWADGMVTKHERQHIKREQQEASKNIFRKRHNNRTKM